MPDPLANIIMLRERGLNILALDDYEGIKIVGKIRALRERIESHAIEVREYPSEPEGNPHRRRGPNEPMLVTLMVDPSVARKGTHSRLVNHCGAAFPKNDKGVGKRCHRPFRELSVRWDGSVAVCCNDWRGEYKCGSILTDGLEAVWQGAAMDAARRRLYQGKRDFGPCKGCDAVSYRVGFLPDPKGLDEMPSPDEESQAALERALEGKPYTVPVLRPWEQKESAADVGSGGAKRQ